MDPMGLIHQFINVRVKRSTSSFREVKVHKQNDAKIRSPYLHSSGKNKKQTSYRLKNPPKSPRNLTSAHFLIKNGRETHDCSLHVGVEVSLHHSAPSRQTCATTRPNEFKKKLHH